ncbi:DUF5615 family PIN-like protein [Caldithrix abyssi]|nr:DUF5615 family PIN-like protein [Caldithrix abyssi]
MRFFIDNNLGQNLANGMKAFGEDVVHLLDIFPNDVKDTEWLEYIGKNGYFLITRDDNIRYNPSEIEALKKYKVGAFFLGGKNRSTWDIIRQLVRNWHRIKEYANKERKPFAVRIPPSGTKFTKYNI